jgi:Flp pilus assembly protein TadG
MRTHRSPAETPEASGAAVKPKAAGDRFSRLVRRDERGVALTEFALVLPWLLLLLLGMVDFGKAINYWIDETHLANEGARFAVVNKNPGGAARTLQQYLLDQVDSGELHGDVAGTQRTAHGASVNICFYKAADGTSTTAPAVGDTVLVLVKYDYQWLRGLPFPGNPSTTIAGKSAMRLEAPPTNYSTANNIGGASCPTSA